ncbi:MAG TPA: DNA polymerase III subunit gamma/tau [Gammaproteobacteria bacterium]|nr:DNA polymerase III subunit gamma/tau [Gammaproteobacteria bacterium]
MSYLVLARKWRPRNFAEIVGQEHVLRALINALDNNRLHHAFLFAGTRGVGKTTIARILAKSLNCEKGVSSRPCGECSACVEIDAGRFVDLIEVDAASRTKVDDTRDLLDNVQYAPSRGRYKVYLIDEVHMLSTHSFNALLKTLEEPPPHVKFLLATTDPQKLPVTVLSRCLQFNLKRLSVSLIQEHLKHILEAEKIPQEPAAVTLIALAADGSLRDALSVLDQAIAYGGGNLREADVRSMLGSIEQTHVHDLLEAVAHNDGKTLLATIAKLDEMAPDYELLLDDMASVLQHLALVQTVPDLSSEFSNADSLQILSAQLSAEEVQLFYQIALLGKRDLTLAPSPRSGFEMTLLRMLAFAPASAIGKISMQPVSITTHTNAGGIDANSTPAIKKLQGKPTVAGRAAQAWQEPDWIGLVESLDLRGAAQQLALNCAYRRREGKILYLEMDAVHEHMATEQLMKRMEDSLSRYFGEELKLRIQQVSGDLDTPAKRDADRQAERLKAAQDEIIADPKVQELCEAFGTQVNPELVKPVD